MLFQYFPCYLDPFQPCDAFQIATIISDASGKQQKYIFGTFQNQNLKVNNTTFPAGIYLFKVNNGKNRRMCETFSKLTLQTQDRRH